MRRRRPRQPRPCTSLRRRRARCRLRPPLRPCSLKAASWDGSRACSATRPLRSPPRPQRSEKKTHATAAPDAPAKAALIGPAAMANAATRAAAKAGGDAAAKADTVVKAAVTIVPTLSAARKTPHPRPTLKARVRAAKAAPAGAVVIAATIARGHANAVTATLGLCQKMRRRTPP